MTIEERIARSLRQEITLGILRGETDQDIANDIAADIEDDVYFSKEERQELSDVWWHENHFLPRKMRDSSYSPDRDELAMLSGEAQDIDGQYIKRENDDPVLLANLRKRVSPAKLRAASDAILRMNEQELTVA